MISTRRQSEVQRVTSTLDRESLNFLDFIKTNVKSQVGPSWRGSGEKPSQIAFSAILPPVKTSRAVATQGLMNVLTLATKGVLALYQDPYEDESSARFGTRYWYGEIHLRLAGL
jgi:meiotic recombination protein REC8